MPLSTQAALLESAGNRDRPIFLRNNRCFPIEKDDPDALVYAATVALTASPKSRGQGHGRRRRETGPLNGHSLQPEDSVGTGSSEGVVAPANARPVSPSTHIQNMYKKAHERIELHASDQHHRYFYLSGDPPARRACLEEAGRKGLGNFGTKKHIWGEFPTDYRTSNWYIENQWCLRSLQRSESEPVIQHVGSNDSLHWKRPRKQPWTESRGVNSCMVGGVGGGLKSRNIGLYEASFPLLRGHYQPPAHGLSTTDVTRGLADMVTQKILLCKRK